MSPFSLADLGRIVTSDAESVYEPADRGQRDAALPERREHLLYVAEEERVRADDEHTLALEREAVGVEEVRGPVEGHGRLAGPRAALDDEDTGKLGADDRVLLSLDGGDDVAHPAGPCSLERSE